MAHAWPAAFLVNVRTAAGCSTMLRALGLSAPAVPEFWWPGLFVTSARALSLPPALRRSML